MLALHAKDPSSILGASTRCNNLESVEFLLDSNLNVRIFVQLKLCEYYEQNITRKNLENLNTSPEFVL